MNGKESVSYHILGGSTAATIFGTRMGVTGEVIGCCIIQAEMNSAGARWRFLRTLLLPPAAAPPPPSPNY